MTSVFLYLALARMGDPISIRTEVGRVDLAVAKLAKVAEMPLRAEEPVASEVVFLDVDKLPLQDLLDRLARVSCGKWERAKDGVLTLRRPPSSVQAEARKEFERRLKILTDWRKDVVKCLDVTYDASTLRPLIAERMKQDSESAPEKPVTPEQAKRDYARYMEINRLDPVWRAEARILRDLDLSAMAAMESESSLTYSTRPKASQGAIGNGGFEAMASLLPEQNVWGPLLRAAQKPNSGSGELETDVMVQEMKTAGAGNASEFFAETVPWGRSIPFTRQPVQASMTVTRVDDAWSFSLSMTDQDGKPVFRCQFDDDVMSAFFEEAFPKKPDKTAKPLPLANPSPETLALWERLAGSGEQVQKSLAILGKFHDDPLTNDPLWIGNQEVLSKLAAAKGKSVIACLTDASNFLRRASLSLDRYLQRAKARNQQVTEDDEAIEIRPLRFEEHWRKSTDRTAMGEVARQYRATGKIDLLSYVRMVASTEEPVRSSYGCRFAELIDPKVTTRVRPCELPEERGFIRLLASLSEFDLDRLRHGYALAIDELTPVQQQLISRLISTHSSYDPSWRNLAENTPILLRGSFAPEQVAVFHNAIPGPAGEFWKAPLTDASSFSFSAYEDGPQNGPGPGGVEAATIDIRSRGTILLAISASQGQSFVGRFAEPLGEATDTPVPLAKLPRATQERLKFAVSMLKEMSSGSPQPGDYGGGPAPPP